MSTICGHDREALRWVLNVHVRAEVGRENVGIAEDQIRAAHDAVFDPAKLAKMLAELGQWLGAVYGPGDHWENDNIFALRVFVVDDALQIAWKPADAHKRTAREFSLTKARAILLAWLDLPKGARDKAEKVLRGET